MSRLSEEQAIIEGQSWAEFCDILKRTGGQIMRPEAPADAFTRAEGFRYLTRLARIGLDMFVESGDPAFPTFYRPSHETAKIGADNPDNYYQRAEIDPRYDYRISGTRGTVHYLGFGTMGGGYGEDGRNDSTGYIDAEQMQFDADGRFELLVSQQQQPGNWLPMTEATNTLLVRQTFLDRSAEAIAELNIERVGAESAPEPLDPAAFSRALKNTAAFVEGTARLFADWSQSWLDQPNELPPSDQAACQAAGGDPNIFYYHSYWDLKDGEALVIDVPRIPACQTWNFQLDNYWMESLDYRYHTIHVNKHTAHYRDDGSVRIIVSHRDPGLPNWIETAGHRLGTMCFRWIRSDEVVHPQCRVVPVEQLQSEV